MKAPVEIDDIDNIILRTLVKNARTRLKDIAKDCGISSVSVLNRIKRLKTLGVITGATMFIRMDNSWNWGIAATIGIELNWNQEEEVGKIIREQKNLMELAQSIGKYDLCAFVQTYGLSELEKLCYEVRKHAGVKSVTAMIWSKPHNAYENVDLQPKERESNGQT
jgi:DNA-binding Lrp family transcriptional regulator